MQSLFGLKGKDFTMIACDTSNYNSIIKMDDTDKFIKVNNKLCFAFTGECGDIDRLLPYAAERLKYENLSKGLPFKSVVAANIVQEQVQSSLRSAPLQAATLIADSSSITAVDAYGAMWTGDYISIGYAQYFLYGLLDNKWKKGMDIENCLSLVGECCEVLKNKFVLGNVKYRVAIVAENGISIKDC